MKNVVIVPAWNRPELLFCSLERLALATGIDDHRVFVVQDNRENEIQDDRIHEVVCQFYNRLDLRYVCQEKHGYPWPGRNALLALQLAYDEGCEHIFYVEDDVMVAKDFFHWHYAAQTFPVNFFCSIASRDLDVPMDRSQGMFHITGKFNPLGVCFPRDSVEVILNRYLDEYFRAPVQYIQKNFGFEPFGDAYYDWDGLVGRICFYNGLTNARAVVPRCFHSGIYGANRTHVSRLTPGPWRAQATELKSRWQDPAWMTKDAQDCTPCELETA